MRKRIIFLIILSLFWGHATLVSAAPVLSKKAPALVKGNASEAIPNAPSNLTSTTADYGRAIVLHWQDNATDEVGFKIEKTLCPDDPPYDGGWVEIARVGTNITEYIDTKLVFPFYPFHRYRITAYNDIGYSANSNILTTTWGGSGKVYGYARGGNNELALRPNIVIMLKPNVYGYGTHDYVTNTDGTGYFEFNDVMPSTCSPGGQISYVEYKLYIDGFPASPDITFEDPMIVRQDAFDEQWK